MDAAQRNAIERKLEAVCAALREAYGFEHDWAAVTNKQERRLDTDVTFCL